MTYEDLASRLGLVELAAAFASSQEEFDAIVDGDRLVAELVCVCGYKAVCVCSAGWDGPTPIPTRCPDCGATLLRVQSPPGAFRKGG